MEELKRKFLFLTNLLTSSSNQGIFFVILSGLILVGLGILLFKTGGFGNSSKIEVINTNNAGPDMHQDIIVEIAGAVEKPGVYKMKNGDRVDDLLTISGGLAANADRLWVDKNINRATKIVDGQKIYIYQTGEVIAKKNGDIKVDQEVLGVNSSVLVNINTASLTELDKLPGIGPVYGQRIIDNRNYSNIDELVKKGVLKQSVFDKIKNLITI